MFLCEWPSPWPAPQPAPYPATRGQRLTRLGGLKECVAQKKATLQRDGREIGVRKETERKALWCAEVSTSIFKGK